MKQNWIGRRLVAALFVAAWLVSPLTSEGRAQSGNAPWQKLTPSQLTAVWWQWALGIPVSDNPLFDTTGADAFVGQPYTDLAFLCAPGTVTQLQDGTFLSEGTREISVKQGTTFFFPLLNIEWDNVLYTAHLGGSPGPAQSIQEMRATAAAHQDGAYGLFATVTPMNASFTQAVGPETNLAYARLQSPVFSYQLPRTDNIYQSFGIDISGAVAPAVSDGYWAFLPGNLAPGNYQLEFGGTSPDGTFIVDMTYLITVTH